MGLGQVWFDGNPEMGGICTSLLKYCMLSSLVKFGDQTPFRLDGSLLKKIKQQKIYIKIFKDFVMHEVHATSLKKAGGCFV